MIAPFIQSMCLSYGHEELEIRFPVLFKDYNLTQFIIFLYKF